MEVHVLRIIFLVIIAWDYYEIWQLKRLIANRRLTLFLRKLSMSFSLLIGVSIILVYLQILFDLDISVARYGASIVNFLFFGYIAWIVRRRRIRLDSHWTAEDRADASQTFEEIFDVLEVELKQAKREAAQESSNDVPTI